MWPIICVNQPMNVYATGLIIHNWQLYLLKLFFPLTSQKACHFQTGNTFKQTTSPDKPSLSRQLQMPIPSYKPQIAQAATNK
jgi:hypothetical protein